MTRVKVAVKRFIVAAEDRKYRPLEVWAFRLASGYIAVKLGIKATR